MIIKEYEDRAKALVEQLKTLDYEDQQADPEDSEFYTHPDLESLMRFTNLVSNDNPTVEGLISEVFFNDQELNPVIQEMIEELQYKSIVELGTHIYGSDYEERLKEFWNS